MVILNVLDVSSCNGTKYLNTYVGDKEKLNEFTVLCVTDKTGMFIVIVFNIYSLRINKHFKLYYLDSH